MEGDCDHRTSEWASDQFRTTDRLRTPNHSAVTTTSLRFLWPNGIQAQPVRERKKFSIDSPCRIAHSGRLARVLKWLDSTSSQPVGHCPLHSGLIPAALRIGNSRNSSLSRKALISAGEVGQGVAPRSL